MKYLVQGNFKANQLAFSKGQEIEMSEAEAKALVDAGLLVALVKASKPEEVKQIPVVEMHEEIPEPPKKKDKKR